ncbi:MAG TPA: hypothetical protein VFA45_21640 [Actinomycetes bacterium]|jgi:antitoxin component of MazEF toxin-antitoxin module|nr:hypothetical protein [Actinomycetes bacterium]
MPTRVNIADPPRSYPPTPVIIDRPTDDLLDFIGACQELRRRLQVDLEAQVKQTTAELADQHTRHGRPGGMAALVEAARWQVYYARRRAADLELHGLHPAGRLLEEADKHEDGELYRRREAALRLLLSDEAVSYDHLAPLVLADRESACRQQTILVEDQQQLTLHLARPRGLRGLLSQRRARQLGRELRDLDHQLGEVQAEIAHQQALWDGIQAADANRAAWLAQHQPTLREGAAAVVVLTRRVLARINPPGCDRPVATVDLDHPTGDERFQPPTTNGSGEAARIASPARRGRWRLARPIPHGRADAAQGRGARLAGSGTGSPALPSANRTHPTRRSSDRGHDARSPQQRGRDHHLGSPIHAYPDEPRTGQRRRWRLRPSLPLRRVDGATVAVCYLVTLGTATWLLVEASLYMAAPIMVLAAALLIWLATFLPRLAGWLRAIKHPSQPLPPPWVAQLVVGTITALNLFLVVYAHL